MLAVSPLRNAKDDHQSQGEMEVSDFSIGTGDFPDFSDGNLLDSIDFDDLFVGIHDGDVLPDLEMDPELLAEFSASGGEESEIMNVSATVDQQAAEDTNNKCSSEKELDGDKFSGSEQSGTSTANLGEEVASKIDESAVVNRTTPKEADKGGRKPSGHQSKNSNHQGKRKVKVDWTPELHRRFVQAVEQLGVDKAVPSRILELMGIDCLTRHNIASHLQKYRSHRKHLLAREAEAASWSQRRQVYGAAAAVPGGGKREVSPWLAPAPATIGFPPVTPMPHFRPLHVWGHPTTVNQSVMNMWPKHLLHSPSPPPPVTTAWAPVAPHHPPPPLDASFWHPHRPHVPNAVTPVTPCFPPSLPQTRFATPPVPGIPPHPMYKVDPGFGHPTGPSVSPRPPFDFHPSKESVDAAIGDVLSKPWQPLPLGLKPPSLDSVMGELHRQGIPKIPPSCA